MNDRIGTFLVA